MTRPLVLKFGGDALALPERIAQAARRVGQRLGSGPVVAVASARRGVTDHLLGLVERVKENTEMERRGSRALAAASDRAVAAGELVAASLLTIALNRLGIPAEVLDAREAGLRSNGEWARAQLADVKPVRISRLLRRGITPVVTGFQGWYRGQTVTLGRGGSDTTAVALAAVLGARECELIKHHGGVFTADPKVVPEATLLSKVSHRFLTELAAAGAKVIAPRAANLAERDGVVLRFSSLDHADAATEVQRDCCVSTSGVGIRSGRYRFTAQTAGKINPKLRAFLHTVAKESIPVELEVIQDRTGARVDLLVDPDELETALELSRMLLPRGRQLALLATGLTTVTAVGVSPDAKGALRRTAHFHGAQVLRTTVKPDRLTFVVPDAGAQPLARAIHTVLFASTTNEGGPILQPQRYPSGGFVSASPESVTACERL